MVNGQTDRVAWSSTRKTTVFRWILLPFLRGNIHTGNLHHLLVELYPSHASGTFARLCPKSMQERRLVIGMISFRTGKTNCGSDRFIGAHEPILLVPYPCSIAPWQGVNMPSALPHQLPFRKRISLYHLHVVLFEVCNVCAHNTTTISQTSSWSQLLCHSRKECTSRGIEFLEGFQGKIGAHPKPSIGLGRSFTPKKYHG